MNADTFARIEADAAPALTHSPSVVVVTTVDGTLRNQHTGLQAEARAALNLLTEQDVPVVLWSMDDAAHVIGFQTETGLRHPFICRGGAEVYVPSTYFPESVGLGREDGPWTVIDCSRAQRATAYGSADAQAIRLLVRLYRVYRDDVLIVGVGSEWRDRDLLHEVDVSVVIRRSDCDQARLVRRFPDAYVTRACGPAGWCEAILGAGEDA